MDDAERLALSSLGINVLVTGLKYFLGIFSGSLALIADAVHSSADIVSSASIWVGIRISRRKTKRFPYGLYKVENLVALFTSVIILLAGSEIVHTVLWSSERVRAGRLPYAIAGVITIALILLSFSRYELRRAKRLDSPSLKADAQHLSTDLFSSCVILVGLVGTYLQIKFPLDKAAALIIVGLIVWMGLKIMVDAIRVLLDASLDYNTMNSIREVILETPQVSTINSLTGRSSGKYKFIETELMLKVRELEKAHFVANQIESRVKSRVTNVDHILIHYEPVKKETRVIAMPVREGRAQLSEHFGEAPYFLLITLSTKDGRLLRESWLYNPFRQMEKRKGIKVSEWLVSQGVDELIAAKNFEQKGPYYVFADAGVVIDQTEETNISQIKASLVGTEKEAETHLEPQ